MEVKMRKYTITDIWSFAITHWSSNYFVISILFKKKKEKYPSHALMMALRRNLSFQGSKSAEASGADSQRRDKIYESSRWCDC